jgi:hypothetical protein
MKHKLLLLSAAVLLVGASCKKVIVPTTTPPALSGTFSGQFLFVHRQTTAYPYDTLKANVILTLQSSGNTFTVTGDTTTVHAGSYGIFTSNTSYVVFIDKTYPTDGTNPKKIHLAGTYQYYYDGSILQMLAFPNDTSAYEYSLKKN